MSYFPATLDYVFVIKRVIFEGDFLMNVYRNIFLTLVLVGFTCCGVLPEGRYSDFVYHTRAALQPLYDVFAKAAGVAGVSDELLEVVQLAESYEKKFLVGQQWVVQGKLESIESLLKEIKRIKDDQESEKLQEYKKLVLDGKEFEKNAKKIISILNGLGVALETNLASLADEYVAYKFLHKKNRDFVLIGFWEELKEYAVLGSSFLGGTPAYLSDIYSLKPLRSGSYGRNTTKIRNFLRDNKEMAQKYENLIATSEAKMARHKACVIKNIFITPLIMMPSDAKQKIVGIVKTLLTNLNEKVSMLYDESIKELETIEKNNLARDGFIKLEQLRTEEGESISQFNAYQFSVVE